jgi:hypothetical protein
VVGDVDDRKDATALRWVLAEAADAKEVAGVVPDETVLVGQAVDHVKQVLAVVAAKEVAVVGVVDDPPREATKKKANHRSSLPMKRRTCLGVLPKLLLLRNRQACRPSPACGLRSVHGLPKRPKSPCPLHHQLPWL